MFIHWGPVSLTGHEIGWSRGNPTPIATYDVLYRKFDPRGFDADAWVATAKAAGMRYLVITAKHHDGFCLWPSEHTEYDIGETPFRRDVVGELAAACRRQGIAFGTYYSVPDWYHPDYPKGSPAGRSDKPDPHPERYAAYLRAQVTELVTRYGPLLTLWFDMPRAFGPEYGVPVVEMLRGLQPDIVVNNRAYAAGGRSSHFNSQREVGDYDTPEQRIGGFQRDRPWETCMTICRQWAWKPDDRLKSLEECVHTLIRTIGGDGNLLLNVGPMPDGRIEERQVARLRELGAWVQRYEKGIYGTRGGPFMPGRWGASTCRGDRVFLFVLDWPAEGPLVLPSIPVAISGARVLSGGAVRVTSGEDGIRISLPLEDRSPLATVIELTLDGPAFAVTPVAVASTPSGSLAFGAKVTASNTFKNDATYGPGKAIDDDPETRWATDSGTSEAWLEIDLGAPITIARVRIDEPEQYQRIRRFAVQSWQAGSWKTLLRGTAIGPDWSRSFEPVTSRRIRLHILAATEGPTLREFQLFPP
jgi:alpha-L-fucosidase